MAVMNSPAGTPRLRWASISWISAMDRAFSRTTW
jgi:hypothetical protein